MNVRRPLFVTRILALTLLGACGGASGDAEQAEHGLLTDIREARALDYVVDDDDAVFATTDIGNQNGLFRVPVGVGAPTFIDGFTHGSEERNVRRVGLAQ